MVSLNLRVDAAVPIKKNELKKKPKKKQLI